LVRFDSRTACPNNQKKPDTVRFRFFGGIVSILKLFPEKKFALPFISDPRGVHRPFKFHRRFKREESDL
jgi:hypothetical protein